MKRAETTIFVEVTRLTVMEKIKVMKANESYGLKGHKGWTGGPLPRIDRPEALETESFLICR